MKNLNTIIKLTCLVMFCLMSTVAFSQSNERVVFKKGDDIVNNYDGTLQSIGAILNTNTQTTIDRHITKLKADLQQVNGSAVSTNELDVMLDVTQANYVMWSNAYDQLKITRHQHNLYVIRSIIANIKSQL